MRRLSMTVALAALLVFWITPSFSQAVPDWWLGSDEQYNDLVTAAKKEGKVVWWSHPDPECRPLIIEPFEKKYGIEVEHTEYRTAQIVQRILLEGVAGIYTVDVANMSVHHVPRLEEKGLLKELPYKERIANFKIPGMVSPNSTAFIGWTAPRSLAYTTSGQLPMDEVPKTYEEVLNPKFEGKISVDTDLKEYVILAQKWGLEKTEDYLKRLGAIKPKFHPSNTVITQMVAAGEVWMAPGTIRRIPVFEFKAKGAPIDWLALAPDVPIDTLLQGVMANAPHPNAAALWVYWMYGAPQWLEGMYECGGYGNSLIPGNPLQKVVEGLNSVVFGWDWGVKSAKEGLGEKFRKIIGVQ